MPVNPQPFADSVRLDMPARPRFLSVVRVVAAALGADIGLTVDDLDELRLGVNELVALLIDGASDSARVALEVTADGGTVTMRGRLESGDGGVTELDELTRRIVEAVVDHVEVVGDSFVLTKASSAGGRG